MENPNEKTRINKYLANKGFTTRRGADALIEAGKVFVNGVKATLGQKIDTKDSVEVRDKKITTYRYLAYNKPKGYVTNSPTEGEKEISGIFDMKGIFPLGRLDKNSEGLLILTNDGRLTDRLLNPKYDHEKEYLVETERTVNEGFKTKLEKGVDIGEGEHTKPCKVELIDDHHFSITITEGKKHQVKRMTEALGVSVKNLKRVRIMNITLGKLKSNTAREIKGNELENLLKTLGL